MEKREILQALKEQKITPEEAKRLLAGGDPVPKAAEPRYEKIAVIGMSGRFPGSGSAEAFWENLQAGKDCTVKVPASRWDMSEYYDPEVGKKGRIYCDRIGLVENAECFDPRFFGITPAEAAEMDPQHRLFLEEAYAAFEDAGYSRLRLDGARCGVYLGIVDDDYTSLGETSLSATGNSNAIGAARIAYFLNLKGPAMAIDTACSSAMVGVHLAINALRLHEIDLALTGGACLYLTPESYISMCEAGMLSPRGQCRTFDNDADGFVPGEGVGALVLKRLSDAERDHDHIYGCIIASGMNQDGRTNGITAPNMGSQQMLESRIYEQYGIHPETISYAEFHGTGTKLGDPIELEALRGAFAEKTDKRRYCAIGALKSNTGHTSATSGVAGIEKILLCMQHRQLVPTLHVEKPNEHFDFENSPFYINTELKPWTGAEPLRACISSFGFSGTNVHAVLEEYRSAGRAPAAGQPNVFVLSARNGERLRVQAENLLKRLEKGIDNEDDFFYTLQAGREAFEERLAAVVSGTGELREKLAAFLRDGSGMQQARLSRNQIRMQEAVWTASRRDAPAAKAERTAEALEKLAERWLRGEVIDWDALYDRLPYRMSLPTYPFEETPCWIAPAAAPAGKDVRPAAAALHPLVQENVSDFRGQRYRSAFTGNEFFLADHQVGGEKILPAAAAMEMARAAAELAFGSPVTELRQPVWLSAIRFEPGMQVEIRLQPREDGGKTAEFEIFTIREGQEPLLCVQGTAAAGEKAPMAAVPLKEAAERCVQTLQGEKLYAGIRGIHYGPAFRAVQSIRFSAEEALGELALAPAAETDGWTLNPAALDAAMQTVSVLMTDAGPGTWLPFSAERVEIDGRIPSRFRTYARRRPEGGTTFDVTLCDEQGGPFAHIEGLYLKNVQEDRLACFVPAWQEKGLPEGPGVPAGSAVLLVTGDAALAAAFREEAGRQNLHGFTAGPLPEGPDCFAFADPADPAAWDRVFGGIREKGYTDLSLMMARPEENGTNAPLFDMILQIGQALFRHHYTEAVPLNYFAGGAVPRPEEHALGGLFRCVRQEIPGFRFRFVWMRDPFTAERLLEIHLKECAAEEPMCEAAWSGNVRKTLMYRPMKAPAETVSPIRAGGVYLITGGLGGVGLLTARYAAAAPGVRLYLTGRSALTAASSEQLESLRGNGAACEYLQADVTDRKAMAGVIERIEQECGKLDGVFHAAGLLRDSLLLNKTPEEARQVLAAKVAGTRALDEAIGKRNIGFMALYSSNASSLGNIGQADYCYGNSYMDHFAAVRNLLVRKGLRSGRTVSLNWPLWKNGGMRIDAESQAWMRDALGIEPMDEADGFRALAWAIGSDASQVMVFTGNAAKARNVLEAAGQIRRAAETKPEPAPAGGAAGEDERDRAIRYFRSFTAGMTGLDTEELDEETPFGDYGIDSIQMLSMTRALEKIFGSLPKTLFFEYGSIGALADYFLKTQHDLLKREMGEEAPRPQPEETAVPAEAPAAETPETDTDENGFPEAAGGEDAIAVIGMSGRYPMADDLRELWVNLAAGRDCIEEVPKDRWDMEAIFDPDKGHAGKSYTKWGGFIRDVDKFDPLFFNMPPVEAEFTDPQVRLFLESAWHAMEDAGYTRESLGGRRVGVYVGVMYGMYQLLNGTFRGESVPASASYAAIANRVSYFFNFTGPSMAVDTMCSSSLTALHLACEDLRRGKTDTALVGGVNLSIHPNKYLLLSYGRFASSDGRCRTFGEGGDGYVPGEGVGTVILKPLRKAAADGDQIYGVILGTAVNSGGKSTGFTVPTPAAQCAVIREAMREAHAAPETISYVEAHGTGTSLGDPIEIDGLNRAFGEGLPAGSCAIGSLKSNIGHLEGAAGIAGLTKTLLQMKYGKLVPSLHSEKLNPFIDFASGPFRVQHATEDWTPRTVTENGKQRQVRRAGVSCFGAGGSNAHVILEDYPCAPARAAEKKERVFVFSAKNPDRLRACAEQFLAFLDSPEGGNVNEEQAAYILQTGREAMECRLAVIASDFGELAGKLKAWLADGQETEDLRTGNTLDSRERLKEMKNRLRAEGRGEPPAESTTRQTAEYWTAGGKTDWTRMYPERPKKCSLPLYPFARERCWVKEPDRPAAAGETRITALLHRNTSDIYGLKFTSAFTGQEAFLRDHRVFGRTLMPAAALTEMARAAAEQLAPERGGAVTLENMTWLRPAYVPEAGLTLETRAEAEDETSLNLTVADPADGRVFCQGRAVFREAGKAPVYRPEEIRERISAAPWDREEMYRRFAEQGIEYGETMRAIRELYSDGKETLVRLESPGDAGAGVWLPPSMLDGALQAAAGFRQPAGENGKGSGANLPFTFDRMTIYGPCEGKGWALLTLSEDGKASPLTRFNIVLMNPDGTVSAEIANMVYREGKKPGEAPRNSRLYIPVWKEEQLS